MDNGNIARVLNELIETSRDGDQGFRACAAGASDPSLKAYFEECAARCRRAVTDLSAEVERRGGKPDTSGSVAGAAHRAWVNIKTAVASKDDLAVLEECERGEDVALKAYSQALEESLPADVRLMVESQYIGARNNHERVRALRDERRRKSA